MIICFYPTIFYGTEGTWVDCQYRFEWETIIGKTPFLEIYNGSFAVYIFWIISGFCLCCKVLSIKSEKQTVKDMIIRLEYYLVTVGLALLFSYILLRCKLNYNCQVGEILNNGALTGYLYPESAGDFFSILKDYVRIFVKYNSVYNVTLWFMGNAFWGTIFSYIFCLTLKRTESEKAFMQIHIVITLFVAMVICICHRYEYLCFEFGVLLKYYGSKLREKVKNKKGINILLIFLFFIGVVLGGYPINNDENRFFYNYFPAISYKIYYFIGAFLIFTSIYFSDFLQKIVRQRIFKKIGDISYAVYLIHFPIFMTFGMRLFWTLYVSAKLQYDTAAFITCICSILLVFAISKLLTKYVKPKLKEQKIIRKILNYI